jgi:hypothetical protein
MPASEITYWLAYMKIEREEVEKAHVKGQSETAMSKQRQKPFAPKGRR